jgi:protein SCO1
VSVDPERDTPAVLGQYLASFNPSFKGYTGTFDDVVGLATNVNIAFGKIPGAEPGTYTVDHSSSIVVVNPFGRYAGFIKQPHQAEKISSIISSLQR